MQVVSINGHDAATLVATLLAKVSGDGFIETGRRYRLARTFAQQYWLFVEQTGAYRVTARDAAGRTVTSTLDGILERDRRMIVNPVNAAIAANVARLDGPPGVIALEFLDGTHLARLRVRAFDGAGFPATLDSAFRVLRERGTTTLILDLRGNGGGVDLYGAQLVAQFMDAPFRYFDHIHLSSIAPSFATWLPRTFASVRDGTVPDPAGGFRVTAAMHPGVVEQRPAVQPFRGRLLVLIDGGSFSTTADVAAQLRSHDRATFVGEETGGGYAGNTSGLNAQVVLPNSSLRLKIMMYDYWNAVRPDSTGRGTRPDHPAAPTVAAYLRGEDPALALARSLAR
jgi:hypothetical protein